MASIERLPTGVLHRILGCAAWPSAQGLNSWARGLVLTSVCRLWTRIVQPLLFTYVHVKCKQWSVYGSDIGRETLSNTECIAKRRCMHVVKRLAIDCENIIDGTLLAGDLLSALQLGKLDWSGVRIFQIKMTTQEYPTKGSLHVLVSPHQQLAESEFSKDRHMPTEITSIQLLEITSQITKNMPNIGAVNIFDESREACLGRFAKKLTHAYERQLQAVSVKQPVSQVNLKYNMQLAYLSVDFGVLADIEANVLLATVESLRILELLNIPREAADNIFGTLDCEQVGYFKILATLKLSFKRNEIEGYDSDTNEIKNTYSTKSSRKPARKPKLHFPRLQLLEVHGCVEDCEILHATFGSTLKKIYLASGPAGITGYSRLNASIGMMHWACGSLNPRNGSIFVETSNTMLGKPTGASQLKLTLGLRFLDLLDMTDLDWKFLTHFTCRCPISLGKLLQLIARLPRLVDLKLVTIRLDSIQTAAAVDELFQRHVGDSALDLNIRKLSITLCIFEVSQEVAYEALCNFAVYCPQLQVFGVPAALQTDVSAFIESYGLEFPHLGRVVIE